MSDGGICMIDTPEVDNGESRMNTHLMVDLSSWHLAKKFKRLYEKNERDNDVKGDSNKKKKEKTLQSRRELITYNIKIILK